MRALFQKDMLEKPCAVVKVTGDTWKKLFIMKIIITQNAKYYANSVKRNKVKSSTTRGL